MVLPERVMISPERVVFGITKDDSMTLEFFGGDIPDGKDIPIKVHGELAQRLADDLGAYCLRRGMDLPAVRMSFPKTIESNKPDGKGRSTEVREILMEMVNMDPADTVKVMNAAARLVQATQEACARIAESVKDGYTSNVRVSEDEQEFLKDPDGPWVLNSDVAKAIREGRL